MVYRHGSAVLRLNRVGFTQKLQSSDNPVNYMQCSNEERPIIKCKEVRSAAGNFFCYTEVVCFYESSLLAVSLQYF